MATYIVTQGPVEHDGKPHPDGAPLKLSEEVAAALLAVGAIELKGKTPAAEPVDPELQG